ncbi:unnamed protein product [Rotaria magnacalcarata]|uniref:G-protein coupled receptors family 1 profile domain-containing protein n=2 Tax=Rotaria magnacalcarata TaxID=392030 RepID=A0A814QN19_9BILA|nr:unnamed protein product [Rotaria magnacalcarata]CAF3990139.1 unnamed protein product [Rotaria magnacalcarata]CAF4439336.1 unnamed protein product [Rotaria magnacalcarata]CAF4464408.1 unnamed protein product [Rotaria magnacalcarata]
MRRHACTLYFIALSLNNLLYSTTILVVGLLDDGYQIRIRIRSALSSKLVTYFGTVLSILSAAFLVLTSIDRWWMSLERRVFTNVRTAKQLIFVITISFSILFIISFIAADLYNSDIVGCRIQGSSAFVQANGWKKAERKMLKEHDLHFYPSAFVSISFSIFFLSAFFHHTVQAYGIFQFILFSCLAPFLMSLFGFMTILNIKRSCMVASGPRAARRIENQLVHMLLVQVGVQVLLNLPQCVVGLL